MANTQTATHDAGNNIASLSKQINAMADKTADNLYEIGHLCHGIKLSKLYSYLGYKNFSAYCTGELDISYPTAHGLATVYAKSKSYGLTKPAVIKQIKKHGVVRVRESLSASTSRSGYAQLLKSGGRSTGRLVDGAQLNLGTMAPTDLRRIERILVKHGMTYTESGQRLGAGEALVALSKTIGKRGA